MLFPVPLVPVILLTCLLCGRIAGELIGGRLFGGTVAEPQLVKTLSGWRCGSCRGSLYQMQGEPITGREAQARLRSVPFRDT